MLIEAVDSMRFVKQWGTTAMDVLNRRLTWCEEQLRARRALDEVMSGQES